MVKTNSSVNIIITNFHIILLKKKLNRTSCASFLFMLNSSQLQIDEITINLFFSIYFQPSRSPIQLFIIQNRGIVMIML